MLAKMFDTLHATVSRNLLVRRSLGHTGPGSFGRASGGGSSCAGSVGDGRAGCSVRAGPASAFGTADTDAQMPMRPYPAPPTGSRDGNTSGGVTCNSSTPLADAGSSHESGARTSDDELGRAISSMRASDASDALPSEHCSPVSAPEALSSSRCSPHSAADEREGPPESDAFVAAVFEAASARLPPVVGCQCPRRRYLIAVITEYLHSQQQHALVLDIGAGTLLLSLLEAQGSYYQLHQVCREHVSLSLPHLFTAPPILSLPLTTCAIATRLV